MWVYRERHASPLLSFSRGFLEHKLKETLSFSESEAQVAREADRKCIIVCLWNSQGDSPQTLKLQASQTPHEALLSKTSFHLEHNQ